MASPHCRPRVHNPTLSRNTRGFQDEIKPALLARRRLAANAMGFGDLEGVSGGFSLFHLANLYPLSHQIPMSTASTIMTMRSVSNIDVYSVHC